MQEEEDMAEKPGCSSFLQHALPWAAVAGMTEGRARIRWARDIGHRLRHVEKTVHLEADMIRGQWLIVID